MASPRYFQLYDGASPPAPLTTATPGFGKYVDRSGASRTAPSVTHLGGGIYSFTPSDDDEATGVAFLLDGGVGAEPRFLSGAIHLPDNSNQFWVFHFVTSAGALWAGAAPSVGRYVDVSGASRTPPSLVSLAAHLYCLSPSSADVDARAVARIDAASGAVPEYWSLATATKVVPPPAPASASPSISGQQVLTGTSTPILWKDYQEELAPPWLRAGDGRAWLRAFGDMKDAAEAQLRDGVKARFPDFAPPDGLGNLAAEKKLEQGPTETTASFRARLKAAWDVWPWAGTPTGLLRALWYAGYTNVLLLTGNGGVHSLDANLDVVTTLVPDADMPSGFWNAFRVIFPQPLPAGWDPTPPDNASDEVNAIRRLVVQWKAGHAVFDGMVVVRSGLVWGAPASQQWGGSGLTWGGSIAEWTAT
jgi:hypothetical protein